MSKRLSEKSESELTQLQLFVVTVFEGLRDLGHLADMPFASLLEQGAADAEAYGGRSGLLRGARQAANECVALTRDIPASDLRVLDDRLEAVGAPRLSELKRQLFTTKIPRLLARGRIRTEEEYYFLMEELNDLSSALNDEQRSAAAAMIDSYESKQAHD